MSHRLACSLARFSGGPFTSGLFGGGVGFGVVGGGQSALVVLVVRSQPGCTKVVAAQDVNLPQMGEELAAMKA
jgi:hypothetical protein